MTRYGETGAQWKEAGALLPLPPDTVQTKCRSHTWKGRIVETWASIGGQEGHIKSRGLLRSLMRLID